MNPKEQLIKEIEQAPEALVAEVLDFFLFVKQRRFAAAKERSSNKQPQTDRA